MERRNLLIYLGLIFVASALGTELNPRGNRPVEQGTRGDKCATQREWPFCTDDDWGPKCPSGCRIQGLLDQYDHSHLKRIEKIRSLLDQYKAKHRSADQVSKQTYDYLKEKLTIDSGNDNSYYDLAQNLRQRIIDMKIKIDRQLRILSALKDRVKDQVIEMQRMEVDIDIKLRSCKGSCVSYTEYQLDKSTYVELQKQVDQLDTHAAQSVESVGTLYVMKSRQLKDVAVDSVFKSKDVISGAAAEQRQDMFPEVKTVKLILEEEGSSSSPASISKVPGTSYSPSTSSSSSSSVPSSSSSFSSSTSFSSSSHSSQPPFSSSSHSSQPSYSSSSHSSQPSYTSSSHSSQPSYTSSSHSSTQPLSSSSHSSTSYSSSSHSSQPSYTSSSHSSQPSYSSSSHSSQPPFSSSSHSSQPPFSSSSHSSTSYSSSSHSSQPSKSITELGGRGDGDFFGMGGAQPSTGHVSTKSVSCTKSVRRTIVHTKDGPVERTEEVMEGGPECQGATDLTKGGMGAFFPSLSHTSSSSSSSSRSTKTMHAGGAKGSLLADDRRDFGFGPPGGVDLGAFMMGHVEDDMPDFHARSVKSTRFERQADYIGKDCVEAYQNHLKGETNGLFKIKPGGTESTEVVQVYCQQEGLMGGWLLVQQRESGMLSFNRTWAEYRKGFGSVNEQGKGEFWLGNKNLHLLTNQGETMLKVELEDWEGGIASAEYIIRVGSEEEGYPLHVSGYTGDAGDALVMPKSDMASYLSHNGMKFSTFDRDNDKWEENCAEMFGGGWWYNNCQSANLNGIYYRGSYNPEKNTPYEIENGVIWVTYKPATYSLKTVRMFIRPAVF